MTRRDPRRWKPCRSSLPRSRHEASRSSRRARCRATSSTPHQGRLLPRAGARFGRRRRAGPRRRLAVIEELARADGSVGWTAMIGSAAPVLLGHLPPASFDAVYGDGPDVIVAGTFNPTGSATPVAGGFRVTGRWSFASGCLHAGWFVAHCTVDDDRDPPLRMVVLPASDVTVLDTWSVSGLCGTAATTSWSPTGSFRRSVPSPSSSHPSSTRRCCASPELCFSTMSFAAVAIGIADGARREIIDLALGEAADVRRHDVGGGNPLFRHQLGRADAGAAGRPLSPAP